MAQIQGSAVSLNLGFEPTYGGGGTTGFTVPFAPTLTAKTEQAINKSSVIDGNASPSQPFLGFKDGSFSGTVPVDSKAFGLFLKGAYGVPATVDNGNGTYTHTFSIGLTIPSMFAEINHGDVAGGLVYRTVGIGINQLSFSLGGDGELLANITGIAKDTIKDTVSSIAAPVDYTDGFQFGQFNAAIAGVSKVKSFDFNYSNNIDTDTYIIDGSGARGGIPKGIADINGSFTALFEDDSLYATSRAFTTTGITTTMTNGLAGADLRSIVIEMQETKFNAISNTDIDSPNGLTASLNYEAFLKSGTSDSAVTFALTNDIASYA